MTVSHKRTEDLEEGEKYRGEVSRISEAGNGLISIKRSYLNLGSIDEKYVGEVVQFRYLGRINTEMIKIASKNPLQDNGISNKNDLL